MLHSPDRRHMILVATLGFAFGGVFYALSSSREASADELTVNEAGDLELPACPDDEVMIWDAAFDDFTLGFPTEDDALSEVLGSDTVIPQLAVLSDASGGLLEATHIEVDPELIGTGEAYLVTAEADSAVLAEDRPLAGLLVDWVGPFGFSGWRVVSAAFCTSDVVTAEALTSSEAR